MNIVAALTGIKIVTDLYAGNRAKKASDAAAAKAQEAANFNADIIMRDVDILEKQREIINANYELDAVRNARFFERDVQGKTRAGYGYANIDMSHGTPIKVMLDNAREFDHSQKVADFNNEITNMQINDAIEETKLTAELTRKAGVANAAGLPASGTASLIKSFSSAAKTGISYYS